MNTVVDWETEIGRVERWACQNDDDIHRQLGITILENQEEEEDDEN